MYPPISLQPKGAFMFCEDASEYDFNLTEPDTTPIEDPVAEPEVKESDTPVDFPHADICDCHDYVLDAINNTRHIYEKIIKPALSKETAPASDTEALDTLEWINAAASEMINEVRKVVIAMHVLDKAKSTARSEIVAPYVGMLLRNTERINQLGYAEMEYTYTRNDSFGDRYDIRNLVSFVSDNKKVLGTIIYMNQLQSLFRNSDDNGFVNAYSDMVDLIRCVFEDPARLARFDKQVHRNCNIHDLVRDSYEEDCDCVPDDSTPDRLYTKLIQLYSRCLKYIAIHCYEARNHILDNGYDQRLAQPLIASLLSTIVNLFGIGILMIMRQAVSLTETDTRNCGIKQHLKLIEDSLKTA